MMDLIIRPSSLSDAVDCPRRFAARHLRDLLAAAGYTVAGKRPAHVGAAVGTGLHTYAAHTLITHLQTGTDPSEEDSQAAAIQEMRERMEAEGCDWDELTKDTNTAEKQLLRMSRSWHRHTRPQIQPVLVEERLECVVAEGVVMSGQIDVAASRGNGIMVRDNKTTKVKRAAHVQLGAYGLLLTSHGHDVQALVVDHIPRVKIDDEQPTPETRPVALRAAVEEAMQAVEDIGRRVAEFRARAADPNGRSPIAAFPANPASGLCSARFCPAHSTSTCRVHT